VEEQRRRGRYTKAFQQAALDRLKGCDNITALAAELGVHRRILYKWREAYESAVDSTGTLVSPAEMELRRQNGELKRLLADKTLEVDFFKGALHKIAARRQSAGNSGETAYTKKFEN
jgi:transposase-like protein